MDFEELALKSLDPSLGPSLTRFGHSETDIKPEDGLTVSFSHSLHESHSRTIDAASHRHVDGNVIRVTLNSSDTVDLPGRCMHLAGFPSSKFAVKADAETQTRFLHVDADLAAHSAFHGDTYVLTVPVKPRCDC